MVVKSIVSPLNTVELLKEKVIEEEEDNIHQFKKEIILHDNTEDGIQDQDHLTIDIRIRDHQ